MDESVEEGSTEQNQAPKAEVTNASPMPLSMPPYTPVKDEQVRDDTTVVGMDPQTPPLGVPAAVPSPMPLSMPPYTPVADTTPAAVPQGTYPAGVYPPGFIPPGMMPPNFPPPYDAWFAAMTPPPPPQKKKKKTLALAAVAVVLVGGLGAGLGAAFGSGSNNSTSSVEAIPNSTTKPLAGATNNESKVYAAVEPAVVDINTNVASVAGQSEKAAGTGMIVTSSGEVLTNNHVVDEATSITVTIQNRKGPDNGQFKAKVIGVDATHDVALLKIQGVSNLPTVSIASAGAQVGDTVYAIGNALGFGGAPTVQSGTITATGRTITAADELSSTSSETLHNLLQTNAQIQSGDSGGPLVNSSGQVVGMDTAASSTDGSSTAVTGFSIPISQARTIANNIANGKSGNGVVLGLSPFLGVQVGTPSTNSGNSGEGGFSFGFGNSGTATTTPSVAGATIEGVIAGSPAAKAGLQAGDVITGVNGTKVTSSTGIKPILAKLKAGDSISVTYVDSSGASHNASMTLAGIPF